MCTSDCSCKRWECLHSYFEYYKDITAAYTPDIQTHGRVALQSHDELFSLIRTLRDKLHITREEVTKEAFSSYQSLPDVADQASAIDLAVATLLMMDSSIIDSPPSILENGLHRPGWEDDKTVAQFVLSEFPQRKIDVRSMGQVSTFRDLGLLNAAKLEAQLGLKLKQTDDIRNHLKLSASRDSIEIYHHISFLKEQLRVTKDMKPDASVEEYIKRGTLPRQISLEVISSIQQILFSPKDAKSRKLLRRLMTNEGFDPDCNVYESKSIRTRAECHVSFQYFGSRLDELYDELEHPTPRTWLEKWTERRKGARHAMTVALAGIAIAIVLGFLGLVVECFSAWVAYQQWKQQR